MKVLVALGAGFLAVVGIARMLRSEDEWHEVPSR
ncbi:hypothetical protein JOE26_001482 [Rhodococcus coprophilus]|uniref:Uncharacterized protein n=1 Tax=Rhodococcus coprophilus TaxID=38310 RepID=A0A2X4U3C4_9NOCA|nr:hypothetical protein [Rhodococcus coprophilus]SQI33551.1 Uncharacterised protein [Rhodococcus coprophilus]